MNVTKHYTTLQNITPYRRSIRDTVSSELKDLRRRETPLPDSQPTGRRETHRTSFIPPDVLDGRNSLKAKRLGIFPVGNTCADCTHPVPPTYRCVVCVRRDVVLRVHPEVEVPRSTLGVVKPAGHATNSGYPGCLMHPWQIDLLGVEAQARMVPNSAGIVYSCEARPRPARALHNAPSRGCRGAEEKGQ